MLLNSSPCTLHTGGWEQFRGKPGGSYPEPTADSAAWAGAGQVGPSTCTPSFFLRFFLDDRVCVNLVNLYGCAWAAWVAWGFWLEGLQGLRGRGCKGQGVEGQEAEG